MAKKEQTNQAEVMEEQPGAIQEPPKKTYRDHIRARYPDKVPENDDGWPELEDRYASETEDLLGRYKESEDVMQEAILMYPELAGLLLDITANKVPLRAALAKYFTQEDLIPQEGDEDYAEYEKAYNERKGKIEKRSAIEQEMAANQEQTIKNIDAVCEKRGYDEAKKAEFIDFIETIFSDMLMKKIDETTAEALAKAMDYDSDVSAAAETGMINGKNQAIEATASKTKPGDIVPMVESAPVRTAPTKQNDFFSGVGKRRGI